MGNLFLFVLIFSLLCVIKAVIEPKFAPYIDVTQKGDTLATIAKNTGLKYFTLAFALGGSSGCEPTWMGEIAINDDHIINQVKELKAMGGDVIISTGGAMGPYLEASCGSASALATAYKKILDAVGSTHLDIDIEASINLDIMNQALAQIQKERTAITVSYTLMVQGDDYGVTNQLGVDVLKNAVQHGVKVDIVNPMTMEFGSSKSSWGDAVISAAESVLNQMKQIWPSKSSAELYSMLGVTPMLGRNYNGKIFDTTHAKQLVQWANSKKIGHLAFWSVSRDNGHCAGGGISPVCSSIAQSDYEFTKIFNSFVGGSSNTNTTSTTSTTTPKSTTNHNTNTTTTSTKSSVTTTTHSTVTTTKVVIVGHPDCAHTTATYIAHESDCNKYYWCYNGEAHLEQCDPQLIWDLVNSACNWPQNVNRPECKS